MKSGAKSGKKLRQPGQVGKSGSAKKSEQGRPLPEDGSPLGRYPVGSCVFLDALGEVGWYLVSFRLGGPCDPCRDPHLRRLLIPPSDPRWNYSPHEARQASEHLVVQRSCWPLRPSDVGAAASADQESDPVASGLRLSASAGSLDPSGSVTRSWRSG